MAAKHDIQRGITAELDADREAIAEACRRAAGAVRGQVEAGERKVRVRIVIQTLGQKMVKSKRGRETVVGIGLSGSNGRTQVETTVERFTTIQSRMFGFIPAGPKRMWGREIYFRFLDALENELRALDPTGQVERRQAAR